MLSESLDFPYISLVERCLELSTYESSFENSYTARAASNTSEETAAVS